MNQTTFFALCAFVCLLCAVVVAAQYLSRPKRKMTQAEANELVNLTRHSREVIVQPRSPHIPALPILGVMNPPTWESKEPLDIERVTEPTHDNMDWLEIGMVSIRNRDGSLVGSSADVQAVMNEYKAKGIVLSAEEAIEIVCTRLDKGTN